VFLLLMTLVFVLASRRRFWCIGARRAVDVVFEEYGLLGWRRPFAVLSCSAFDPPTDLRCTKALLGFTCHPPKTAIFEFDLANDARFPLFEKTLTEALKAQDVKYTMHWSKNSASLSGKESGLKAVMYAQVAQLASTRIASSVGQVCPTRITIGPWSVSAQKCVWR
jgi:hypothetical protein